MRTNETALRRSWLWKSYWRCLPAVPAVVNNRVGVCRDCFCRHFLSRAELSRQRTILPPSSRIIIAVFHPLPQAKSSFLTWLFKALPLVTCVSFLSNRVSSAEAETWKVFNVQKKMTLGVGRVAPFKAPFTLEVIAQCYGCTIVNCQAHMWQHDDWVRGRSGYD